MGRVADHQSLGAFHWHLSRRRFLAISGMTVAGLLATACGGEEGGGAGAATEGPGTSGSPSPAGDQSTPGSTTSGGTTGEPRHGGTLVLELGGDPPNFDTHQNSTYRVLHPTGPCYNMLVQFDPLNFEALENPSIVSDLAESWEVSDDGLEVTFSLLQGVKFHHGKAFSSEDVVASISRIMNPPEGINSPRKDVFSTVDRLDAPDEHTVTFVLKQPTPSLITNLAQGWMQMFPKDILDEKGHMKDTVSGTGPFKFKSYQEGVKIELERNPDYHVPDRPYLDAITFFIIPDPNTAISSLISGQVMAYAADFKADAEQVQAQLGDQVHVKKYIQTSNFVLEMNADRAPWDDVRVRQACSLAIDRQAALDLLTEGEGMPNGVMHPQGVWALSQEELAQIPGYGADKAADIERAKQLLADAGYADGIQAAMLVRQGREYEDPAIFIADQLAQIGIQATLDVNETATFYEKQAARDFDLFGGSYSIPVDDPDGAFGQSYLCGAGRNYSNYCVDDVENLYTQQSQELDPDQRKGLVNDLERAVLENVSKVVLGMRVNWYLRNTKLRNYERIYSQYLIEKHQETWLAED